MTQNNIAYRVIPQDYANIAIKGAFECQTPTMACRECGQTHNFYKVFQPNVSKAAIGEAFNGQNDSIAPDIYWQLARIAAAHSGTPHIPLPGSYCGRLSGRSNTRLSESVEWQMPWVPLFSEAAIVALKLSSGAVPASIKSKPGSLEYYTVDIPVVDVWSDVSSEQNGYKRCAVCDCYYEVESGVAELSQFSFRIARTGSLFRPKGLEEIILCSGECAEIVNALHLTGLKLEAVGTFEA